MTDLFTPEDFKESPWQREYAERANAILKERLIDKGVVAYNKAENEALKRQLIDLKKERDQLRSGCYACEGVAVTNKKLSEQVAIARDALENITDQFKDMSDLNDIRYEWFKKAENALAKLQSKDGEV
jgi:uncharacterized phage infection (PIP) family protein YhgE